MLALLPTLFFFDVLVGRGSFYVRDLAHYYYPAKHILREIVLSGEFPYWNRFFGAGQPIAANPEHEVFYPLTWLILLPDYFLGFRLLVLSHIYISLAAMYALLRSMARSVPASFFGALIFGLGGTCLSYINLLPILFSVAWMPLTCLYTRRFLIQSDRKSFVLASLFFGVQILVGEPTTILQTGLLLGMYGLYRGWYADGGTPSFQKVVRHGLRMTGRVALITITASALGAIQLFPAIDHVGDSVRASGFPLSVVGAWSMPFHRLAELVYPNALGYPFIGHLTYYWAKHLYGGTAAPFLYSIYSGMLFVSLLVAAFFIRPRGGRFVLLLFSFGTILALGANTPLLGFLHQIGVWRSIRYPEKFFLMAAFALILFAARLLDQMLDGNEALRRSAAAVAIVFGGVALAAYLASFTPRYSSIFAGIWSISPDEIASRVNLSRTGWLAAAVRGLVLFLLLFSLRRIGRRAWLAVALVFVVVDLYLPLRRINPLFPASFFTEAPVAVDAAFPGDRSTFRLFHEPQWNLAETRRRLGGTAAAYWGLRNGLYPVSPGRYGIATVMDQDFDMTALLSTDSFVAAARRIVNSGRKDSFRSMAAMSNVWYRGVFSKDWIAVRGRDARKAMPVAFEKVGEFPRYYFADSLVLAADREEFVRLLSTRPFSDSTAFVTGRVFHPAQGRVIDWRETSNSARIEVEAAGRAFLVMSVTPHKYWRVTIDGSHVPAEVVNLGYQGVVVPPGRHVVQMNYRNDVVVRSAFVSVVTGILLALALVVSRDRTRLRG